MGNLRITKLKVNTHDHGSCSVNVSIDDCKSLFALMNGIFIHLSSERDKCSSALLKFSGLLTEYGKELAKEVKNPTTSITKEQNIRMVSPIGIQLTSKQIKKGGKFKFDIFYTFIDDEHCQENSDELMSKLNGSDGVTIWVCSKLLWLGDARGFTLHKRNGFLYFGDGEPLEYPHPIHGDAITKILRDKYERMYGKAATATDAPMRIKDIEVFTNDGSSYPIEYTIKNHPSLCEMFKVTISGLSKKPIDILHILSNYNNTLIPIVNQISVSKDGIDENIIKYITAPMSYDIDVALRYKTDEEIRPMVTLLEDMEISSIKTYHLLSGVPESDTEHSLDELIQLSLANLRTWPPAQQLICVRDKYWIGDGRSVNIMNLDGVLMFTDGEVIDLPHSVHGYDIRAIALDRWNEKYGQ